MHPNGVADGKTHPKKCADIVDKLLYPGEIEWYNNHIGVEKGWLYE